MSKERFLVTGALGCIGAWVVHELVVEGAYVAAFDLGADATRLQLLLGDDALARVPRVVGDISDLAALEQALDAHSITNVIHLAALQVPFCRADPPLGALVNVVGTVNVLEAVRRRLDRMAPLVYASSVAAYGADGTPAFPSTIYGVYKRADEGAAAVYLADEGVPSIGLRPHTVYGVGRDQGLTSEPTRAMLHAAAGLPHAIPFSGALQLQHARDVARTFVASSRSRFDGAGVFDLGGSVATVADVVDAIVAAVPEAAGTITVAGDPLPFPTGLEGRALDAAVGPLVETPLSDGVAETIDRFRALLAAGRLRVQAPLEVTNT